MQPKKASMNLNVTQRFKASNDSLIQLLEFILTKNNFKFSEEHYLHVGDTIMGTKTAPSYANTYMVKFEEDVVYHTTSLLEKVYR